MQNVRHQWENFLLLIEERPKAVITFLSSILALIVFCLFILPFLQQNIRNQEVQSTVYADVVSTKVKGLPLNHLEKTVASKQAHVILFYDPTSTGGEQVVKLLTDKEQLKQLSGTIYLYPLIYQKAQIRERYTLADNPVAVSFKDGKAGYRMEMKQQTLRELKEVFVPQLNSLLQPS